MARTQHRKQRTRFLSRKTAAAAVLSILVLTAVCLWAFSDPFPRLEIAGFRITQEEYLRAMYQARSDVLSDHAAAGISLKDWGAETPLGDPRRLTMERTLEILREYYAVSTLAVERGYLADAGYDAMQQDMEEINRQRREALDAGDMVTGFLSFTTEDYLTYRASGIRLQFCSDPGNPENQIPEEDILRRYETDRDNLYRQPDSMELIFLLIDAAPGVTDTLEQSLQALRQRALETGGLAPALEEFPQLKAHCQEISVTPETYSVYARSHGDILTCAADLQTGSISQVFRQEDRLCLVQCIRRTVHQYVPLEDVQSVVVQSIRESRYDALIAERMENTEILGDLNSLYRFTGSQLP